MANAHVNGVDLEYDRLGGPGDPTVLVHGSLVDRSTWGRIAPALSQNLEVLLYDRRGFGGSSLGPRDHPVRTDAEDLAGLLAATDLYPAHVVAHSYGGAVALRLAVDHPEMVRSLALHEPPFFGVLADNSETRAEGRRLLDRIATSRELVRRGESTEAARIVVEAFSLDGGAWDRLPAGVRETFAARMDRWSEEYGDPEALRPPADALSEILVPVLLSTGEKSPSFLHVIEEDLVQRLPNALTQTVLGASHAPHLTHPEAYVGMLVTFLLERNVPVV